MPAPVLRPFETAAIIGTYNNIPVNAAIGKYTQLQFSSEIFAPCLVLPAEVAELQKRSM